MKAPLVNGFGDRLLKSAMQQPKSACEQSVIIMFARSTLSHLRKEQANDRVKIDLHASESGALHTDNICCFFNHKSFANG